MEELTNSDSSELRSSNVTKGKHGKVNIKLKICRGHQCYYEALLGHDASSTLTTMDFTVEISDEWDDLANLGEEDWTTLKD